MTILCLAVTKGPRFPGEPKRQGCHVVLLTSRESARATELAAVEGPRKASTKSSTCRTTTTSGTGNGSSTRSASWRARAASTVSCRWTISMSRRAAMLREHSAHPGMGETTARYFRDKLAMRMKAQRAASRARIHRTMLNHGDLAAFLNRVPGLGPQAAIDGRRYRNHEGCTLRGRSGRILSSSAICSRTTCWSFRAGDIFHVDTIVYGRRNSLRRRQRLRPSAARGLAWRRNLHHSYPQPRF